MKKIFVSTLIFLAAIGAVTAFFSPRTQAADANLTGNWVLALNHNGNVQMHDMTITGQDQSGNLSGTGGFPRNEAYSITWRLKNSRVKGNSVNLEIHYNNSDFVAKLKGTIQSDGILKGSWTDNRGLQGEWGAAVDNTTL